MPEVLVLVDHLDGAVRKPTYELLTIAKRLGEPSAVFIGGADQSADVAEKVKKYGAEKVYVVDDAQLKGYLVAPKAEALQQLAEKTSAGAILIPSSAEGKEIAARLAIKLESGLITDAVDVQEGPVTTQSVFAGNFTVTAKVTKGTPIITVKPNAATPEESAGAGAVEEFSAEISESAKKAQIVASQPRKASGRPELNEAAAIDGAKPLQRFWYITWPLLLPVTMVVVLFSVIQTFADFQIVYVMTGGGPANATHLFATYAYQIGIGTGLLSEGAAISLAMFPVLFLVVIVQLLYIRRVEVR